MESNLSEWGVLEQRNVFEELDERFVTVREAGLLSGQQEPQRPLSHIHTFRITPVPKKRPPTLNTKLKTQSCSLKHQLVTWILLCAGVLMWSEACIWTETIPAERHLSQQRHATELPSSQRQRANSSAPLRGFISEDQTIFDAIRL